MQLRKILKTFNIPIAFLVLFLVFYLVQYLTDNTYWAYGAGCIVAFIPAYLIDNMEREKSKGFKKTARIEKYLMKKDKKKRGQL